MLALVVADFLTREPQAPALELSADQLDWVGEQIFRNECASRYQCLVHWNEGEAFPSLGIGHFIWYPEDVDGRFVESFPALVRFMAAQQFALPEWLAKEPVPAAPWPDRKAFLAAEGEDRVGQLRALLAATKGVQSAFIFRRARESLGRVLASLSGDEQDAVQTHLEALSATPGGTYALIDYVNFKGEGLSAQEAYQGQGWGLRQVLLEMEAGAPGTVLERFREAAGRVLTRRAHNTDKAIERERWLPGWLKRLQTYREPGKVAEGPATAQ